MLKMETKDETRRNDRLSCNIRADKQRKTSCGARGIHTEKGQVNVKHERVVIPEEGTQPFEQWRRDLRVAIRNIWPRSPKVLLNYFSLC